MTSTQEIIDQQMLRAQVQQEITDRYVEDQQEFIEGSYDLSKAEGDTALRIFEDFARYRQFKAAELATPDHDSLGPCGCNDYHYADCPSRTGNGN